MRKALLIVLIAVSLVACKPKAQREPPFKVGQIVLHVLTKDKGIVLSMRNSCQKIGGSCFYYIRFKTKGLNALFQTIEVHEFELTYIIKEGLEVCKK